MLVEERRKGKDRNTARAEEERTASSWSFRLSHSKPNAGEAGKRQTFLKRAFRF